MLVLHAQSRKTVTPRRWERGECFVCVLVGCLTSQQHAAVSQGQICSDKCTCCHTEIEVALITLDLSPSQSILTPCQPVPALTLSHQAPGRAATGVAILKSLVGLDPKINPHSTSGNRTPDQPLSRRTFPPQRVKTIYLRSGSTLS